MLSMVVLIGVLMDLLTRRLPEYFNLELTKGQRAKLERIHSLAAQRPWAGDKDVRGEVLLRKTTYPKFTLTIYERGVQAKFVFEDTARRRFVPYDMISGVFPARYSSPGRSEWTSALQLETMDGETFLVRSWYYDLEEVMAILRDRLGARWSQVYRGDVVLEGHMETRGKASMFVTGELLRHSAIRS